MEIFVKICLFLNPLAYLFLEIFLNGNINEFRKKTTWNQKERTFQNQIKSYKKKKKKKKKKVIFISENDDRKMIRKQYKNLTR